MALSGRELLLIVRAQNQASQALRRVAGDMQRLGSIRDMHFRQNQLAINQQQIMRQRQRALNELESIEGVNGARRLSLQRRQITNRAQQLAAINQLEKAQVRLNAAEKRGLTGPPLTRLTRDVDRYGKQLESAKVGAQQLAAAQGVAAQRASVLRSEIATATQRLGQNAIQQREIAKAISQQRWERLRAGAGIATHFGRVMQLAGLVGGAAVGLLAKSAADFNTQATLVATQTGPIGTGFQKIASNAGILQKALLGVMAQGTATKEELTGAAYDIFSSLTLPGGNLKQLNTGVAILRQLNMASIAGATSLDEVTQGVVGVLGAFKEIQPTGANVHKLLQRMFAAVRFGRMTFREFAQTLGTTAPAARAAGQSFDTLAGTVAFLSRPLGINKAAVGFARLTEILGRKKMVDGLRKVGVEITNTHGKMLQMPEIIDRITKKFPDLTKGGVKLVQFFKAMSGTEGTIQARRAFVFLAQQLDRYRLVLGQTTHDNNEFKRSFDAMSRTAGVRWAVFVNRLKAAAITIGAAVLPALLKLSEPLQKLIDWFTQLDQKQKDNIGKWATYVAAFLLVGGTIISVGGMILGFISILGRLGIAGAGISVMFLGVVAAVKVLRGEWRSLNDVMDSFSSTMLGSFKGFVAMAALLTVAALKIKRASMTIAAASAVGGAAGARGGIAGLLGGIGGAAATGVVGARVFRAEGAGRLSAALRGAAVGAAALPGPLKIAAVAIGAGAAAAALWKMHMQGVEEHSQRIARFQAQVQAIGVAPAVQARQLGGLGGDVRDVLRQRNAVAELNAQIKQTRRDLDAAAQADRPALQRQLTDLVLNRADALDVLHASNVKANASFGAMTGFVQRQLNLFQALGNAHKNLTREREQLRQAYQKVLQDPSQANLQTNNINRLKSGIQSLRSEIGQLGPAANRNANILTSQFSKVVRSLQRIRLLPQKVSPTAIQAMIQTALKRGRMLTIPEMKMVIKAVADPAALRKLPRDVQAAVARAKVMIKVQTDAAAARKAAPNFRKAFGKILPALQIAPKADMRAVAGTKGKIANVFKKRINQPIHLGPVNPDAVGLGATIAQGIASGVSANSGAINGAVVAAVDAAVAAGKAAAQSKSPSKRTRREIGVPLAEGIVQGVLSQLPSIEKSSRLAIDFFMGPWLSSDQFSKITEKRGKDIERLKKRMEHLRRTGQDSGKAWNRLKLELSRMPSPHLPNMKDLLKDLRGTVQQFRIFNNSLTQLARRGVPLLLLDQLSQLGVEGAKKIEQLAKATDKQLKKYIALWRAAMREVKKSTRGNFETIVQDLPNFINQAAQNMLDKWNEFHDNLQSNFGQLFVGLDDKIGESIKSAIESWQSNITDLQTQIEDSNKQIVDLQVQAREKISEEFGHLFDGAYIASEKIQNKLAWGKALNMDDLTRDLQSQVDAFNSWRTNLISLASRVPAELLKQLTDLGPSAAGQIAILANSTEPELAKYVGLWQQAQANINTAVGDALPDKAEFQTQINDLVVQISGFVKQINELLTQKPAPLTPEDLIKGIKDQKGQLTDFTNTIDALRKRNIPTLLLQQLAALGPDALPMLQALNSMTDVQLKEYVGIWKSMNAQIVVETNKLMQDQIKLWKQHGADIAAGIIAGVMSEQEALLKFFRNLFLNLLKAARRQTKSNSPSKVFQNLGEDLVNGLAMGIATGQGMKMPMPGLGSAYGNGGGFNRSNAAPISMTVNAQHDESLMTTLERAAFRLRNRRP